MATDSFIILHEGNTPIRINTHRILAYKPFQHKGGAQIIMNIGGVTYEVAESPDEIDEMVVMAKDAEHKRKNGKA